ncbi:MAG: adenosylcobinamide-GDP ribazoletransferase [Odoribacter sp.]|nr:adenosylcobinamide-GDP ribazoletransferase [Odoribacter sp.]
MKSLLAAVMMFTRIPLWRFVQVDKKYYTGILLYWPIAGFLTGLTTWGTLYLASLVMPLLPACVIAVIARLLLTGALHEDGLADFFDGFGGGHDKESILRIMKDSHIGSYGTIGLILYFILYVSLLGSFYSPSLPGVIIGADVLSKLCTAVMVNTLPYARTEEESKVKVLYRKIRFCEFAIVALVCLTLLWLMSTPFLALIPTLLVLIGLRWYFKRKIGGYTGDCCGASVLLAEQFFYIGATVVYTYFL